MAGIEPLCDYCSKVPLSPDELMLRKDKLNVFLFGSWPRIFASRCPLCRLVKHSYWEGYRTDPSRKEPSMEKVRLIWTESGPAERGAFWVYSGVQNAEQWICFAADTEPATTTLSDDCFNYLYPIVEAGLDVSRVSQWTSACTATHGDECALRSTTFSSAFPGLHVLRLIDVQQGCLVEIQDVRPYLALSYMWGAVSSFRLTKANLQPLLVPGAIKRALPHLPRTIFDTITLAQKLGARYIWVDALCLLQNDRDDLERGVNVMDLIYERSWLTVVAACGSDANADLPGVRLSSRPASDLTIEVKPQTRLGLHTSLDQLLQASAYHPRGWTFQEHVLCRRALYFVDSKVFFRCRNTEFSESFFDRSVAVKPTSTASLLPEAIHMEDPLHDYAEMLSYYTRLALTDQTDVLRAMAGIIRRVSEKVKYRFIQGLPTGDLDAFVIFHACDSILRRRSGFPSYSWCGWRGGIEIGVAPRQNRWLASATWIIWHKRSESGVTNLVWDIVANDSFPAHDVSYVGYRRRRRFQHPVPLGFPTTRTAPTESPPLPSLMPPYPVLQFWTLAVYVKMNDIDVFSARCNIHGKSGVVCGNLFLDGFEESPFFFSEKPFEMILLSVQHEGFRQSAGENYNVLLLEYKEGLAERRGSGIMRRSSIRDSFSPGPIWKEIVLG
ncbi:hypothetical protein ACJ41O_012130 [Fusarium nematophilum]